ncbi:MAG: protease SohB [Gammaproteobacteria bacterium]|nr:protease SohB [Gammaproteobacteria bacterium]
MHFLANYGLFLLKVTTILLAIIILLVVSVAIGMRKKVQARGTLRVKKINRRYRHFKLTIEHAVLSKKAAKQLAKQNKKHDKEMHKDPQTKKRIFVLNFNGDIKCSQVGSLREEITALLLVATSTDEVIVCLESPGGMVHGYGLAASQLQRIREHKIPLTICVDKVAASGGYMMACVANKIIAAPFAIVGSIGVVMQLPNFHRLLEKNNVEYEQITAGEYKRTLTMFGKNTDKDREKVHAEVEETQVLFKDFIKEHRPIVNIDQVATGEHWFAHQAIKFKLVDSLQTSDEYLLNCSQTADLYSVKYELKKSLAQKLGRFSETAIDAIFNKMAQKDIEQKLT